MLHQNLNLGLAVVFPSLSEAISIWSGSTPTSRLFGLRLFTAKASFIPFSWSPSCMSLGWLLDDWLGDFWCLFRWSCEKTRIFFAFYSSQIRCCTTHNVVFIQWPMPFLIFFDTFHYECSRLVVGYCSNLSEGQRRFGFPHMCPSDIHG